jgi:hypothetical protein
MGTRVGILEPISSGTKMVLILSYLWSLGEAAQNREKMFKYCLFQKAISFTSYFLFPHQNKINL